MNILLVGFMGSGKSTVGSALAKSRRMAFVDLDAELESAEGRTIAEIFKTGGEAVFRQKESAILQKWATQQLDDTVISTGGGIVLDEANIRLLKKMGKTVWLDVSAEEAFRRVGSQTHRPLLQAENSGEKIAELMRQREPLYRQADVHVPVDGKTVEQIVDAINEQLRFGANDALRQKVFSAIGRLHGTSQPVTPSRLEGSVSVPPSKSVTHRALLCAALSRQACRVSNALVSDDTLATAASLKVLGARFDGDHVDGKSLFKTGGTLNCGESGSTLRFLLPLACLGNTQNVLTGDLRLQQRPIQPLADALNQLGGRVQTQDGHAPVIVHPGLSGGICVLPGDVSSQFVSGLLMALPLAPQPSRIELSRPLESKPYVDLTVQIMHEFGVRVTEEKSPDGHTTAYAIQPQAYIGRDFTVPSDWSSAAFWLAAGCIGQGTGIRVQHIQPDGQADTAIISILQKMGGKITHDAHGAKAETSDLVGTDIDASQCPDLVPILAVLGCVAQGTTRIMNAARLRLKESDRLAAICEELRKMGADIDETDDGLLIRKSTLAGATLSGHNDHRIAMALAIAAANATGPSVIDGADCVAKSYPAFFADFKTIGGNTP